MLSLSGITKRFAGVLALDHVDLSLERGEVVGVIGENGAGKSTLMKVIGGVFPPDEGEYLVDGRPVHLRSPFEALNLGIRVIYQELTSLDNLDITANLFLGFEKTKGFALDEATMHAQASQILAKLGLDLDPATRVSRLSIAQKQIVEIARALTFNVKVLILDEPTSSLTMEESRNLFRLVSELKAEGVGILYISHRMDEVEQLADRVVALRNGKNSGNLARDEIKYDAMIRLMVGKELERGGRKPGPAGEVRLDVKGLATSRYPNARIDLTVRAGEIVGLAGLVGSGRSEMACALFGIEPSGGTVKVDGAVVKITCPGDAIQNGVLLVPEDRKGAGLTVELTVGDNVVMPNLAALSKAGLVDTNATKRYAEEGVKLLGVKTSGIGTAAKNLSGGNQQKVVLARWLMLKPKILLVDEPTRGVDVGAKAEIYAELRRLAQSGVAVLMISSDMEEILNESDRILVMRRGEIAGELSQDQATQEKVLSLAMGGAA